MSISIATKEDVPALVTMINSAYRGEDSKKGWTTEAYLVAGELRTDSDMLIGILEKPGASILKYSDANDVIIGCVYLQVEERGLYLGMLTVAPALQAKGTGRQLLKASELHAKQNNCNCIFMNVVSLRTELIEWYERHGYHKTGETKPFPEPGKFGVPTQELEFVILEKKYENN